MKVKLVLMAVVLFSCTVSKPGIELGNTIAIAHFEDIAANQPMVNPLQNPAPAPVIAQQANPLLVNGLSVLSAGLGLAYFFGLGLGNFLKNKNEQIVPRVLGALGCAFLPILALNVVVLPYLFIKSKFGKTN